MSIFGVCIIPFYIADIYERVPEMASVLFAGKVQVRRLPDAGWKNI